MGKHDDAIRYGKLKAVDYARLLKDAREARLSLLELETEAARKSGKLANLLDEHGKYWWIFYDLPYQYI